MADQEQLRLRLRLAKAKAKAKAKARAETGATGPATDAGPMESVASEIVDFLARPRDPLGAVASSPDLRGFTQGVSLGFGDEVVGGLGAAAEALHQGAQVVGLEERPVYDPSGHVDDGRPSALDEIAGAYRKYRDAERSDVEAAQRESPGRAFAGQLLGAMALPLGAAKSVAGRLATATGLGGLAGYGSSEEETPGVGAATGAGLGLLGGLAGEGLSRAGGALKSYAQRTAREKAEAAVSKAIASGSGRLGSSTQGVSRDLEVIAREADALPEGPLRDSLRAMLASDEGLAARSAVAAGKLERLPGGLREMASDRAALQSLLEAAPAEVERRAAEMLAPSAPLRGLAGLARTHAAKLYGPVAGAMLGGAAGGAGGAAGGAGLGTLAYLLRKGGAGRNLLTSPGAANLLGSAAVSLGSAAPGLAVAGAELAASDEEPRSDFAEWLRAKSPEQRERDSREHFLGH